MTKKEKYKAVQHALQYLIAEGVVKEVSPGYYRLKTKAELDQEMLDLIAN